MEKQRELKGDQKETQRGANEKEMQRRLKEDAKEAFRPEEVIRGKTKRENKKSKQVHRLECTRTLTSRLCCVEQFGHY